MPTMLSKSRYLNGLQCPRLLWIATNEPERIPEPDASTQHIFDQGHLVGELANKLYPGGREGLCSKLVCSRGGFIRGWIF